MVGKKELIGDVDNIAPYTIPHNNTNLLYRGLLSSSIIKRVDFISKEAKGYAYRYLKIMGESINPVFHIQGIMEYVTIKGAELKGIAFLDRVLERCCNISFYEGNVTKRDKTLKMLYKKHNVPIVHTLSYQNYLTFFLYPIKRGLKVA